MKTVAIIGMGARGLGVLERLTAIYREMGHSGPDLDIHLIDPGEYGQGTHSSDQQQHLLANTVASQVTMFADETVTGAGAIRKGPSLLEWARLEGYRKSGNQYYKASSSDGEEIQENEYLPRALLGEYLTWTYDYIVRTLPPGIYLSRHKRVAIDLKQWGDGTLSLTLDNGYTFQVDYVFLTTGHGHNLPDASDNQFYRFVQENSTRNPHLQYCRTPYALRQLKSISQDATVAIQGLGLSAHDVISELTAGRGGRFVTAEDGLKYVASGREPRLLLFSRNSLPFSGRATNQKGVGGQYQSQFFTREAINGLRKAALVTRGSWQLDFEKELWPLLMKEMAYVYRGTKSGYWQKPESFEPGTKEYAALDEILYPTQNRRFESLADFTKFIVRYLEWDLEQARGGNRCNPIKTATDMFRDVRSNLRYAVDFGGLTPASHRQFMDEYCPIMGRVAIGPPKERNEELLALLEAGIVEWAAGPNAKVRFDQTAAKFAIQTEFARQTEETYADVLIKARIEPFLPEQNDSLLMRNLLRRGLVRPYFNGDYHPGGIDITKEQNPIGSDGQPIRNVWALGNIVEGPNFYTHVLPQPCINSGVVRDAGRCVLDMFSRFLNSPVSADEATLDDGA